MQPAIVLGSTHATVKHVSFNGQRFVIVQPVGVHDEADGPPLIAVDAMGCRRGDRVILTSDAVYAREVTGHQEYARSLERDWDRGLTNECRTMTPSRRATPLTMQRSIDWCAKSSAA